MMRLKDLVKDTNSAAANAMSRWEHQPGSLKFWRASANYIYRFENGASTRFMRMTHFEEKQLTEVQAEIEFLLYLHGHGYRCAQPVLSQAGNLVEVLEVDGVTYYVVVFTAARGRVLEMDNLTDEQALEWGESLGRLHLLSMGYRPVHHSRLSWRDWLDGTRRILEAIPGEDAALGELGRVHGFLESLPAGALDFGLIHYDFQQDNILWDDDTAGFEAIDFDDCHYHFYAMDLSAAVEDVPNSDRGHEILDKFLGGYAKAAGEHGPNITLDSQLGGLLPGLRRYSDLVRYGRILRSLQDSDFPEDPPWLQRVRPRLVGRCARLKEGFGRAW